jgi:hypothetical protein
MGIRTSGIDDPGYVDGVAVTPGSPFSASDNSLVAKALWIGGTGNVSIETIGGNTVVFNSVPVGIFPVAAKLINASGTTATNIVALF